MNWSFWAVFVLFSPFVHASTSVIAGPHWWRETAELPSPSPPYSLEGEQSWWRGKAAFSGSVIESACLIEMDNVWQNVVMKKDTVKATGNGTFFFETPFTLKLKDCDMVNSAFSAGSRVKIMVYGISIPSVKFPKKTDTPVQLIGLNGEIVQVGEFMPPVRIDPALRNLKYTLRFTVDKENIIKKYSNATVGILVIQE